MKPIIVSNRNLIPFGTWEMHAEMGKASEAEAKFKARFPTYEPPFYWVHKNVCYFPMNYKREEATK